VRISAAHNTQIASPLLIDDRLRAISTNGIRAYPAMMLPKEISKISKANDAIRLFLECFRLPDDNVCVYCKIPGKLRETILELLPFMKDLA